MPVFIVLLGILTALAGFAALAFGIQNWAFGIGNTLIASGSIAAVGGLLLVGLGLVLRSLRVLAERIDNLTPAISGEFQVPLLPQELPLQAEMPVPLPPMREPIVDDEDEEPVREVAYRRDEQFKRVREAASRITEEPKPQRIERPAPATTVDEPLEQDAPATSREQRRAWPPRTAMRLEEAAEKKKSWPFDRPPAAPQQRVYTPAPAPVPEPEPEPKPEHEPEPAPATAAATVAVMRSGIISGMAYTLYADGSIEAELPLGTVRFGSVEELRAHVARTGADADTEFSGRAPAS